MLIEIASKPAPGTDEDALLDKRRLAAGLTNTVTRDGKPLYSALALSGGGIRSATFALGFLQAICARTNGSAQESDGKLFRESRLSRFDYLSTVSGGGYVGAFLCSLFQPDRLRGGSVQEKKELANTEHRATPDKPTPGSEAIIAEAIQAATLRAADDAVRVLGSGAPGRIRSDDSYAGPNRLRAPTAWLRENGRYLIPTGVGDAFYAGALGIRNWLALHYVIGTVLTTLIALVAVIRAWASESQFVRVWEHESLCAAIRGYASSDVATIKGCVGAAAGQLAASPDIAHIWWSPLFPTALATLMVLGVPLGVAFWLVDERRNGKSWPINVAVVSTLGVAAGLIAVADHLWPNFLRIILKFIFLGGIGLESTAATKRFLFVLVLGVVPAVAVAVYVGVATFFHSAAVQRVKLTRGLGYVLALTLTIAFIATVDTIGQSLYLAATYAKHVGPALTPAALAGVLVWLARKLAAKAPNLSTPSWLRKIPVFTLAGLAGIVIFVLVGSLWSMLVHWFLWGGDTPRVAERLFGPDQVWTLWWVAGGTTVLAAVTGYFSGFINLSSLQPFYGSRLTRAYLGASNGERFAAGSAALSAAEPLPSDDLAMEDYVKKMGDVYELTTFAPLHIINVTVNKTVDPAEQLVQRDRKGQPMAVLPFGFSIDRVWHRGFPEPSFGSAVRRPMLIGQWVGTSGAAFSTGIGRETSLGMSLLMGAANVRLGTWWESGLGGSQASWGSLPLRALGAIFRTQTYLSYELRARFFGTHRRWQYLSDGGHFENTGIYELLRKERRVFQIFGCDNGADPHYRFDDVANLIRLARIDLGIDLVVQTEFTGSLAHVFAPPSGFAQADSKPKTPDSGQAVDRRAEGPAALMLWATRLGEDSPSTQIVLVKPNVCKDAEADIQQYAVEHPSFPQEPTADQFFDEAQWESYRALGFHLGNKIFNDQILGEVDALARLRIKCDALSSLPADDRTG